MKRKKYNKKRNKNNIFNNKSVSPIEFIEDLCYNLGSYKKNNITHISKIVNFIQDVMNKKEKGVIKTSSDIDISYICSGFSIWLKLFYHHTITTWGFNTYKRELSFSRQLDKLFDKGIKIEKRIRIKEKSLFSRLLSIFKKEVLKKGKIYLESGMSIDHIPLNKNYIPIRSQLYFIEFINERRGTIACKSDTQIYLVHPEDKRTFIKEKNVLILT